MRAVQVAQTQKVLWATEAITGDTSPKVTILENKSGILTGMNWNTQVKKINFKSHFEKYKFIPIS